MFRKRIRLALIILSSFFLISCQLQVIWESDIVNIDAFNGSSKVTSVSFTAQEDIQDVNFKISHKLSEYISVEPTNFTNVHANKPSTLVLNISIPAETPEGIIHGTLYMWSIKSGVANPLEIELHVATPNADTIPETIIAPSADRVIQDTETKTFYVKDELLIVFNTDIMLDEVKTIVSSIGGVFLGGIQEANAYKVQIPKIDNRSLLEEITLSLEALPQIIAATPSWLDSARITLPDEGSDPEWGGTSEWDESSPSGSNWAYEFIQLPSAWDITTGNSDAKIKIAVFDLNFDVGHEDLIDNRFYFEISEELLIPSGKEHGTAVAGIIAAKGNNSKGISGAMWDADLMLYPNIISLIDIVSLKGIILKDPLKVMSQMRDAISRDARIINYSAGINLKSAQEASKRNKVWETIVINDNPNVLFVFAAGQQGVDDSKSSPSSLENTHNNVISVTEMSKAIIQDGIIAEFSGELAPTANYGDVTVAAPGSEFITTLPSDGYGNPSYGGTSFAAPLVSGLAGLILSVNKDLTASDVKDIIKCGAESPRIGGTDNGNRGWQIPGHNFYAINAFASLSNDCLSSEEVLFHDDFNDNSIDISNWEYSGNTVSEINGELHVDVDVTDQGGRARTHNIVIDPNKPIKIIRKLKVYAANKYFGGLLQVIVDGHPEHGFGVSYADYIYSDGVSCPAYGFSIYRYGAASLYCTNLSTNISPSITPIWGTWFNEVIDYDPVSGDLVYSINGQTEINYNVGALPMGADTIQISFAPWGWSTGHYMHIDDFSILQFVIENISISSSPKGILEIFSG